MPMTKEAVLYAIEQRMGRQWLSRLREELAPPIAVIGVKQMAGDHYGQMVLCTTEDMPVGELVLALRLVADQLERQEM